MTNINLLTLNSLQNSTQNFRLQDLHYNENNISTNPFFININSSNEFDSIKNYKINNNINYAYVLCMKNNIYDKNINKLFELNSDIDDLKNISNLFELVKISTSVLDSNDILYDSCCIVNNSYLYHIFNDKYTKIYDYEIVCIMIESTKNDILEYISLLYVDTNKILKIKNQYEKLYGVNKQIINNNTLSNIKINSNEITMNETINETINETLNKTTTNEIINEILNLDPIKNEYELYRLLNTILISKKYYDIILLNENILNHCSTLFKKYDQIFQLTFGYAFEYLILDNNNNCILNEKIVSSLPSFSIYENSIELNPYIRTQTRTNEYKMNILCDKNINYKYMLNMFKEQLNLFTTGDTTVDIFNTNSDNNIWHDYNLIGDTIINALSCDFNTLKTYSTIQLSTRTTRSTQSACLIDDIRDKLFINNNIKDIKNVYKKFIHITITDHFISKCYNKEYTNLDDLLNSDELKEYLYCFYVKSNTENNIKLRNKGLQTIQLVPIDNVKILYTNHCINNCTNDCNTVNICYKVSDIDNTLFYDNIAVFINEIIESKISYTFELNNIIYERDIIIVDNNEMKHVYYDGYHLYMSVSYAINFLIHTVDKKKYNVDKIDLTKFTVDENNNFQPWLFDALYNS